MPTDGAFLAGRAERVDSLDLPSISLCFVVQLSGQLRPARITDCFAKMPIPHHIAEAQSLAAHRLIFADEQQS